MCAIFYLLCCYFSFRWDGLFSAYSKSAASCICINWPELSYSSFGTDQVKKNSNKCVASSCLHFVCAVDR